MNCCDGHNHEDAEMVHVNGPKPRVFEANIERRKDKRLGFDLDFVPERKVLPVKGLLKHQLAEDWNEKHKELAIQTGDKIVSVNGITGRADAMMRALRDGNQANTKIKFVRMAQEAEDQDVIDAAEAYFCYREGCSTRPVLGVLSAGFGMAGATLSMGGKSPKVAKQYPEPSEDGSQMNTSVASRGGSGRDKDGEDSRRAVLLDEARRELPASWLAIWSKSQNKYYYFNARTQESAWRRPLGNGEVSSEDNGSVIGSWAYSDGAYTISKEDGVLQYREDAHGVHGIVEEQDGWLCVDLLLNSDEDTAGAGGDSSIGRLRFLRRGNTVISNFQRIGHGDAWEEDVVATKALRSEKLEDPRSLVGTWSYHNGTYTVSRKEDRLLYEESCYGIYGWLEEVPGGWQQAELRALSTSPGQPATTVGWIRLKRRGPRIVSNYKGPEDADWEPQSEATKEVGTVEGEWMYPDGTYTITNKNGFLLYEEPLCGIFGVLQQDSTGWLEADLLVPVTKGDGRRDDAGTEKNIGKIRLQRRGNTVVSNFRGADTNPWERDIVATRVDSK